MQWSSLIDAIVGADSIPVGERELSVLLSHLRLAEHMNCGIRFP
jgi:hypothetical protein